MKRLEKFIGRAALRDVTANKSAVRLFGKSRGSHHIFVTPASGSFALPPRWNEKEFITPELGESTPYEIPVRRLDQLSKHMGDGDFRYYLNGMALSKDGRWCASNGITMCAYSPDGTLPENFEMILPRSLVSIALATHKKAKSVTFLIDDKFAAFEAAGYMFSASLIDGNFPDTRKVAEIGDGITADFFGVQKGLAKNISRAIKVRNPPYAFGKLARILPERGGLGKFKEESQFISEMLAYEEIELPELFSRPVSSRSEEVASYGVFNLAYLERCLPGSAVISGHKLRIDHGDGCFSFVAGIACDIPENFEL